MPENKRERLIAGDVTVTSSSDEALAAGLNSIVSQLQATGDEVLEGQPLEPKMIGVVLKSDLGNPEDSFGQPSSRQTSKSDHKSSATALEIFSERNSKKKAA